VYNAFSAEPITSLADVFRSQYNHYISYNGRAVAHTIVQIFASLLGKHIFAICNGLIYCLLVYLIMRTVRVSWRNPLALLTTIGMCMLGLVEKYLPSTFVSYFYMPALVMAWLLALKNMRMKFSIPKALIMFVFSVLAGNSHEAFSIPVTMALFVYLILYRREWNAMQIVMVAGFFMGIIIIALSPGSHGRVGNVFNASVYHSILFYFSNIRCFYLMLIVLVVLRLQKKISLRQILFDRANLFWIIVAASLLPLSTWLFGHCGWRQLFWVEIASIIIMLRVLPRHELPKWALAVLLLCVGLLYAYYVRLNNIRSATLRDIVDTYAQTTDGKVYYDITTPHYYPENSLSPRLYYHHTFKAMNGEVIARHPGAPPITVLPTCCRDLTPDKPSQAIMIDDGACVFINNKQHPASKFYITLTRSVGFYHGAGGRYYINFGPEDFKFD
ncbi:MAG: hypothetical protein HUJ90_03685, partial [Bacteroidales bacterium]|nr:hypothetical protein [Bacteroidales bacterium]